MTVGSPPHPKTQREITFAVPNRWRSTSGSISGVVRAEWVDGGGERAVGSRPAQRGAVHAGGPERGLQVRSHGLGRSLAFRSSGRDRGGPPPSVELDRDHGGDGAPGRP